MTEDGSADGRMGTVRFHEYGEPGEVLRLEETEIPIPGRGRVLVAVHACGLAPADWALSRGLFGGELPRGIGCDVSGTVTAIGDGVSDVEVGDVVFGSADWANEPTAGASDYAIMDHWFAVPEGLDLTQAPALVMALDNRVLAPFAARRRTRQDDADPRRRHDRGLRGGPDRADPGVAGDRDRRRHLRPAATRFRRRGDRLRRGDGGARP